MTFIFLARKLPDPISDELSLQGHSVYECLAISEVFALAEEHFDAQIVIAADIEERWATEIQKHYPTLHRTRPAYAMPALDGCCHDQEISRARPMFDQAWTGLIQHYSAVGIF